MSIKRIPDLDLSIVIVNYNVEYFLEQCLNSVIKASQQLKTEIIVVDNNSSDGSIEMLKHKFQGVHLIENKDNVGFSRANNQGIKLSQGKYVLLLNPDTVIEEQTLTKMVSRMDKDDTIGGLGVRMVDGKGNFLPESKRGLPTPIVAFYKIFGLSSLFKKSKKLGRYHLSYLNEFEENEIEILSGAFMCMRKKVLDEIGLLDEDFFMYGEDIDLSYRIIKAGYKNLYFPDTTIIHYKGESTKKSSVNYVFVFYRAMIIFAKKHFRGNNAFLFSVAINSAIYLRASIEISKRIITFLAPKLFNAAVILSGLFALTNQWRMRDITFPNEAYYLLIPMYYLIWSLNYLVWGAFDEPIKFIKQIKAVLIGTFIILGLYALLPKELQFSRLYILIGAAWVFSWNLLNRALSNLFSGKRFTLNRSNKRRFLVVGDEDEYKRVKGIVEQNFPSIDVIYPLAIKESFAGSIGDIRQIEQIIADNNIDEVIFCAKNVAAGKIIELMTSIKKIDIDYKIAQPDAEFIIGSNSIDTGGEMYVLNLNALNNPGSLRSKRLVDVVVSTLLIIAFPIITFWFKNKKDFLANLLDVLFAKKTLVGFCENEKKNDAQLPQLKKGLLNFMDDFDKLSPANIDKVNLIYARDYNLLKDLKLIAKHWKKLDRRTA
jgi:GT2 family glycosyltransferase